MQFVSRSTVSKPSILSGEMVLAAKEAIGLHYKLDVEDRQRRRVPQNPKLWLDASVFSALETLFNAKCAFCETYIGRTDHAQIHHFRPRANAQQPDRRVQQSDYYGWFAYEWKNLFLSCSACNAAKANLFPVAGPRASILCTWDEAERDEIVEIVNPCVEQPWKHLDFLANGTALERSTIGQKTIDLFQLNRTELVAQRKERFEQCLLLIKGLKDSYENRLSLRGEVEKTFAPSERFSGATETFLYRIFSAASTLHGLSRFTRKNLVQGIENVAGAMDLQEWSLLMSAPPDDYGQQVGVSLTEGPSLVVMAPPKMLAVHRASQITRVSIENFKGIEKLDISFSLGSSAEAGVACAMLLGENSTGKSSILQAITLCLIGPSLRDRLKLQAEDFLSREPQKWQLIGTKSSSITIEFDFGPPISLTIDAAKGEFVEQASVSGILVLAYGARRFFGSPRKRVNSVSAVRSLFDPLATLNHPGQWLERIDSRGFAAVSRAMREVLALRSDDDIKRDDHGRIFVKAHGRETPFDRLSDGYRSLFAMVIDVMRELIGEWGNLEDARAIVLIDEIETHLHPRWKMRVISALRNAMPNVQFIATTHDPLCLRGMRNGEVHVFARSSDDSIQQLTGLPDVRGLRAEQLLTSDFFGLASTADPEIERGLEELALLSVLPTKDAEDLSRAKEKVRPFNLVGETLKDQIIQDAMERYLAELDDAPALDRSRIRESAVNTILDGLNAAERQLSR